MSYALLDLILEPSVVTKGYQLSHPWRPQARWESRLRHLEVMN
jgi:hypothetical protein